MTLICDLYGRRFMEGAAELSPHARWREHMITFHDVTPLANPSKELVGDVLALMQALDMTDGDLRATWPNSRLRGDLRRSLHLEMGKVD